MAASVARSPAPVPVGSGCDAESCGGTVYGLVLFWSVVVHVSAEGRVLCRLRRLRRAAAEET